MSLALSRAGVVVVLLGIGRTFAGLDVRPVRVRLQFGLISRRSGSLGFSGEFSFLFPVLDIDSLDNFSESCKGVECYVPYTLVTYTDKNSEPMLTRSNPRHSNSDIRLFKLRSSAFKLFPVPSLVTHPDNPWFQVLSCTLRQTLTNSESCHMLLSHAFVTRLCHMPLSHTLRHPPPL